MTILKREDLVPRIDFFQNSGIWSGSIEFPDCRPLEDEFRYRLEPIEDKVKGSVWHGPHCYSYCKERNEIPSEAEFSINEDGMQELFVWLETSYESMKSSRRGLSQTR